MRKKILNIVFNFVSKYPFLIIALSILLGIIFFISFKILPLKSDYIELLPQNSEPVKNIKYLTKKLKGVGQFSIVVESKSQNTKGMEKFSDSLYKYLVDMQEIEYIQYKIPLDFIIKNGYLFIDTDDLKEVYNRLHAKVSYEIWKQAPIYLNLEDESQKVDFNIDDIIDKYKSKRGNININLSNSEYLVSNDNTMLLILIKPNFMPTEVDKTGALIKKINSAIKAINPKNFGNDIKISFGGTYTLSYDQQNAIFKDIKLTSMLSLLIVFIIVLIFVRNLANALYLFYALIIGVLSSYGFAIVVFQHINLITGFLIAILTGLGVNYGIYLLIRYNEELKKDNYLNALKKSFVITGSPNFIGALTISLSFAALAFSKFLGFSEFGLLASFSILLTFILSYILVVAFIVLFKKNAKLKEIKFIKEKKANVKEFKISDKNLKLIIYPVSIVLVIITVFFCLNLKNIKFEYNSRNLEVKGQESIRVTELIQTEFNISTDPAIFYTYDRNEERDFYNTVTAMMKNKNSLIGSIISISGILPSEEVQREKLRWVKLINKELNSLPKSSIKDKTLKEKIDLVKKITGEAKVLYENDLPEGFSKRLFVNDEGKKLYISQVFPKKILFDANDMQAFVKEVKTIKGSEKEYRTTGMHVLYVFLIDTVLHESKIFISIVFIIIWLLLLIDLKNFKRSFICMLPVVFGAIWLLGIMVLCGQKFNFMNVILLPTVMGTGVVNGINIYHRYKEKSNLFNTLKHTGFANLGRTLTEAFGWASLFFAHYEGLKTMGFVSVVGILTTFLASITVMPAVMILFDRKKGKVL